MQEADADDALADAHLLGGAGTGLGVLGDVLVQLHEVLHGLVMALHLHHGVDDQLGGAGGVGVGHPDQALVFGLEQVVPVLGLFQAQALQLLGVAHEAQNALVDAVPAAVLVAVHVAQQVAGVLGLVGLQQALGHGLVVGIGGAAEPHVGAGVAVFLLDLGGNLARRQALTVDGDAEEFLELVAGGVEVGFLAAAVHGQFALGLRGVDERLVIPLGRSHAAQAHRHHSHQKKRQQFFHEKPRPFPFFPLGYQLSVFPTLPFNVHIIAPASEDCQERHDKSSQNKEISPNVSLFRILLCHSGFLCYNGAKGKKAPGRSRPGFGRKRLCGKR